MANQKDPDEIRLERVAKRMLAMPPKERTETKFGKPRKSKARSPRKKKAPR
jgi:hypothetical protein